MERPRTSAAEQERLRALDRYRLLDTPREQDFDEIAQAAAELCGTPIAVVNLIGDGRQFFKAEVGLGVRETSLESSFCRHALLQEDFLYVPDATQDPRFSDNPLVTGEPGLRFYAGALLKTADSIPLGTVCVLDTKPHDLSDSQRRGLARLARQTMAQMELRRTLREQSEQRRLHERILDSATDYAIVAMDPQGRVTRWNAGAERILGWSEAEMLGRTVEVLFTPEDRIPDRPDTQMRLAAAQGSVPDEGWHLRKDGSGFWATGKLMPLTDEDGALVGFLKILRDCTDQRAADAALEASELRYRSLVEISPQVVWFGDARGHVTYCNAYWYDYTGLPPGETGEASWMSAIHPDHWERTRATWLAATQAEQTYETEFPLRRADGHYRWFLSRAHPVIDGDGTLRSWIGTTIDIHERKTAEERFQALTELAPAIIWFGNPDGSLSYFNDRWYAYTGQTPEEALPMGWDKPVHPDDLPGLLTVWLTAREQEVMYDTVARLRRHDGAYRWFLIRAEPLKDASGAVVGWLGSNSDINDRRQAEEDLREAREQLRLALEATGTGVFDYDLATDTLVWDARTRAVFGLPPGAPVDYAVFLAGLHPDDRGWVDGAVRAVLDPAGCGTFDITYRIIGLEDGTERWVAAKGLAFVVGGRTVRFIGTVRDVTDSRRAEEHQRLLTGELQHRVKNTLAMVQAIAAQTFRNAIDLEAARDAFSARLVSLGRAHDILTQSSWTEAPIAEVAEGALAVHRGGLDARIQVSGPNVRLAAKPALALALAFHELATNAAKYGALSCPSGRVELRWHIAPGGAEPRFCLLWSEHGGPPILTQPTRRGFGSRLIERSFACEVGGEVTLTFAPGGLICRVEAPLSSMQDHRGGPET